MVTSLMASGEFTVMVNALDRENVPRLLQMVDRLTFMDAGDYAIQAQGYFRYAILDNSEWSSVQIEIGDRNGTIQLLEVTR